MAGSAVDEIQTSLVPVVVLCSYSRTAHGERLALLAAARSSLESVPLTSLCDLRTDVMRSAAAAESGGEERQEHDNMQHGTSRQGTGEHSQRQRSECAESRPTSLSSCGTRTFDR